ncbi:MAG TPA: hypothetical protein VHM20_02540 [Gammaproteobacteria bacterium]|jgi:hypothetical protein|nr:hypothetical protein [Gammaproteobacteria bacterium]
MLNRLKKLFESPPERKDFPSDEVKPIQPTYRFNGGVTDKDKEGIRIVLDDAIQFHFPVSEQKYRKYEKGWNQQKWQSGVIGFGFGGGSIYKLATGQQNIDWCTAGILAVVSSWQFYRSYQASQKEDKWKHPLPEYQEKRKQVESDIETSYAFAIKNQNLFHPHETGHLHFRNMLYWQNSLENAKNADDESSKNTYYNFLQKAPLDRESIHHLKDVIDLNKSKVAHLNPQRLYQCVSLFTAAQNQLKRVQASHDSELNVLIKSKEEIERNQQNMETGVSLGAQATAAFAGSNLVKEQEEKLLQKRQEKTQAFQAINASNIPLYEKEIEKASVRERYDDEIMRIKRLIDEKKALANASGIVAAAVLNQTAIASHYKLQKSEVDAQIEQKKKSFNLSDTILFSSVTKKIIDAYFKEEMESPTPKSRL